MVMEKNASGQLTGHDQAGLRVHGCRSLLGHGLRHAGRPGSLRDRPLVLHLLCLCLRLCFPCRDLRHGLSDCQTS